MTPPTEKGIQRAILSRYGQGSDLLMPNYTPSGWWECDVFRLTQAGYFYEYEIKLTRADFKADVRKTSKPYGRFRNGAWSQPAKRKYEELRARSIHAPKQFWYIVPEDLVTEDEIPPFAGLMYATLGRYNYFTLSKVVEAPMVNNNPMGREVFDLAYHRAYHRWRQTWWKD